jgi:hypothetical protein
VCGVPEPDGARRDLLREHCQPGAGPTATHGGHQGQPLNQGARPAIFLPVGSRVPTGILMFFRK